jgi:hypothetical protein
MESADARDAPMVSRNSAAGTSTVSVRGSNLFIVVSCRRFGCEIFTL